MYVPLLKTDIITDKDEQQSLKNVCDDLLEKYPDEWGAEWARECGVWNSHGVMSNILVEDERFHELRERILPHISEFTDTLGIDSDEHDLELHESWVNAAKPKHFQECHKHAWSYISGVFYVHIPENGGDLVMHNPLAFEWNFEVSEGSPLSERSVVKPHTGMLILFPSNIDHNVTKNMSNENRYSLAFNVKTKRCQQ